MGIKAGCMRIDGDEEEDATSRRSSSFRVRLAEVNLNRHEDVSSAASHLRPSSMDRTPARTVIGLCVFRLLAGDDDSAAHAIPSVPGTARTDGDADRQATKSQEPRLGPRRPPEPPARPPPLPPLSPPPYERTCALITMRRRGVGCSRFNRIGRPHHSRKFYTLSCSSSPPMATGTDPPVTCRRRGVTSDCALFAMPHSSP